MKLLMLGWELPPHNSGGLGVACLHLARALARKNVAIDFVLPYRAEHPDTDWMTVHAATDTIPEERGQTSLAYSGTIEGIRAQQKAYVSYVEQLARHNPPDVIHAHDWLTMEAGMRAKQVSNRPLVVHVHATEFDRSGGSHGDPIISEIEYNGLMMADRIIAVSQITKQVIINKYGIPADKIEVVHNASDMSAFDGYTDSRQTYSYLDTLRDEGYTVVSVLTRLTVQKGLNHFLEAAARASQKYDQLVFLVAGDGEQRDELIMQAADRGIADKVFFTGFVRGQQWRDAYKISDIFVMSSVSEPFGLTALEAAHHDNALIISKQSGVGEVLSHVLRYDFWDVDRLADQMVAIATSPALSASLKQNVRNEYQRLSWNDVATKCIGHYQAIGSLSI